jgi:hypothetical protein
VPLRASDRLVEVLCVDLIDVEERPKVPSACVPSMPKIDICACLGGQSLFLRLRACKRMLRALSGPISMLWVKNQRQRKNTVHRTARMRTTDAFVNIIPA